MKSKVITIETNADPVDVTVQAVRDEDGNDYLRLSYWDSEGDYQLEQYHVDRRVVLGGLLRDISPDTVKLWLQEVEPGLFKTPE